MADDFDDLFKSTTSPSSRAGPSTPGWGGYGEDDDLTTANPFADLQSSRLYESEINTPQEDYQPPSTSTSPEALARQFEDKASLSRRSTTSSKASTSSTNGQAQGGRKQGGVHRSNSTSSTSTASGAGDGQTAPSSSEGASEQRRDRVAVSPFITPSDEGENGNTAHLDRSEATIGESELGHEQSQRHNQSEVPFWSRTASSSVYDQEENAAFGGGFGDSYHDSMPTSASSASTPSFNVHRADDDGSETGFNGPTHDEEYLRSKDTEDGASIRTVGLESDNASLKSHKVSFIS